MRITFKKKQLMYYDKLSEEESDNFDDLTLLRAMDLLAIEMKNKDRQFNIRSIIYKEAGKINDELVEMPEIVEEPKTAEKVEEKREEPI